MKPHPAVIIKSEIFASTRNMTAGFTSCERRQQSKDVTKNSYKIVSHGLKYSKSPNLNRSIEHIYTLTQALEAMAAHFGVPAERQDEFARAVNALAKDACSSQPHLVPLVLASAPGEKPGTVVTEAAAWLSLDLPTAAPEKWVPRGKGHKYQQDDETPEDFAVRVYGQWMRPNEPHLSIGMPEILHLDEPLWNALRRSPRIEKPEGFCLPSKKERNDAQIAQVQTGNQGSLPVREWMRLRSAATRRL